MVAPDTIGPPFQCNQPELGRENEISVVLDLDTLGSNFSRVNMNIITTDTITLGSTFTGTKIYDGLGSDGRAIANFAVNLNQTIPNSLSLNPEGTGDVTAQPAGGVVVDDLDISNWSVGTQIQ